MWTLQYHNGVVNFVTVFLLWIHSAIMLHRHSKSVGRLKFWVIIIIPALFFIIQPTALIFPCVPIILGMSDQDIPIYVTCCILWSRGIGGLLFAPTFLVTAKIFLKILFLKNTWLLLHGDLFSSMLRLREIYYMLLISLWLYHGFFSRVIDFPDIGGSILFCHLNFCRCKFAKTH